MNKPKAPKDTGVVTLKNGYKILEAERDKLQAHDWSSGPRGGPDPTNTELWTTSECKAHQFTGFRAVSLTRTVELWLLGEIIDFAPLDTFTPEVMAAMHEKAFATNGSVIEVPIAPDRSKLQ